MSAAREEVLRRIRAALADDPAADATMAPVPRAYATGAALQGEALLARFVDRVTDYRADLTRTDAAGLPAAISAALGEATSVVVPADLPAAWAPDRLQRHVDDGALDPSALDRIDAVLTAAAVGIAETGTVVLDGGAGQGRRAITLVPDRHVCVVHAHQVVATVPEAVRRLDPRRPQTWISGPSATSDIELDRVEGVHGPRTLHVVLVDGGRTEGAGTES